MSIIRLRLILAILLSVTPAAAPAASIAAQEETAFDDAFDLIPPDARAAVVVPHLKRAGDGLAALLAGMDRTKALIGGRPVDQVRALLGLTSGVDENAPVAVIFPADAPAPVYLVPVVEPQTFLESNFDPTPDADPDSYIHPTGEVIFTRVLERHVAISRSAEVLEGFALRPGLAGRLGREFGAAAAQRVERSDLIIYARREALESFFSDGPAEQGGGPSESDDGVAATAGRRLRDMLRSIPVDITAGARASIIALNFDPLALGISAFTALEDDSVIAGIARSVTPTQTSMAKLPDRPFYFAASLDLIGAGGTQGLAALGLFMDLPDWTNQVRGLQFIASPSKLGLQGGLFDETILFINTADPQRIRGLLREQVIGRAIEDQSAAIHPSWEEDVRIIEGVEVDRYGFETQWQSGQTREQLTELLLFGRGGFRGFVGEVEDGLIVTFSLRPDVFTRAVQATRGNDSLSENIVMQQMRGWLPASPDFEVFIGLGQFGVILDDLIGQFRPLIPIDPQMLPRIDPATTPIGFAFDLREGMIESGMILPADAAAVFFDMAARQLQLFDPGRSPQ